MSFARLQFQEEHLHLILPLKSLIILIVPVSLPFHLAALFSLFWCKKSKGDQKKIWKLFKLIHPTLAVCKALCSESHEAVSCPYRILSNKAADVRGHCTCEVQRDGENRFDRRWGWRRWTLK